MGRQAGNGSIKNMEKVIVFGTFDIVHEGHKFMLNSAKKLGETLFVVVTTDEMVKRLKGRYPLRKLARRIRDVEKLKIATVVLEGDRENNTWSVLDLIEPDIIVLGYDQERLRESLPLIYRKKVKMLPSYKPVIYKSSIIKKQMSYKIKMSTIEKIKSAIAKLKKSGRSTSYQNIANSIKMSNEGVRLSVIKNKIKR